MLDFELPQDLPQSPPTEMSSDVSALVDVTGSALAANHIQFFSASASEAKGLYGQRIWLA